MWPRSGLAKLFAITALLGQFTVPVVADDVLSSSGFTNCLPNATIKVENANVQYVKSTNKVTFDVSGSSSQIQKVKATIVFTAYGKQVYTNSFNPCDKDNFVTQLCPGPSSWLCFIIVKILILCSPCWQFCSARPGIDSFIRRQSDPVNCF